MDVAFIKRVYKTSTFVWLFSLLICWMFMSLKGAAGVTVGFGISLGALMVWERLVSTLFRPENTAEQGRAIKRMLLIAILKYVVIGFVLWGALKYSRWISPVGIAVGIGLPYAVIFLKALGGMLNFGSETDGR